MRFSPLLTAALLVSALGHCRAFTWKETLLQNDLLAAMSWALFDMDPYSFLGQNNQTELDNNEIDEIGLERDQESERSNSPSDDDDDYDYFDYSDNSRSPANASLENRQLINFQGLRPQLKIDIRMLKLKLIEIYDKTYITLFLGTGAAGYLDNIFSINGRGREESFLTSLEDLVSLVGVDGPACVHRLLCEMGAAPVFRTNGLFGELLDLTIRHILTTTYADISSNSIDGSVPSSGRQASVDSNHSSSSNSSASDSFTSSSKDDGEAEPSSPISYLDAVAAGRHGANCAHTFDKCPISLLEMTKFINDQNL